MNWWNVGQDLIVGALVAAIPAIMAPLAIFLFRKLAAVGIEIDAGHRASYTAAATRAAGNLVHMLADGRVTQAELADFVSGIVTGSDGRRSVGSPMIPPPIAALVNDVRQGAPDALKHFKITDKGSAIAKKIIGLAGGLIAPGLPGVPGALLAGTGLAAMPPQ